MPFFGIKCLLWPSRIQLWEKIKIRQALKTQVKVRATADAASIRDRFQQSSHWLSTRVGWVRGEETTQQYPALVCLKPLRVMRGTRYDFSHLMSSSPSSFLIFITSLGYLRCSAVGRSTVLTLTDVWKPACVATGAEGPWLRTALKISLRSSLNRAALSFAEKDTHPPGGHNTKADREQKPLCKIKQNILALSTKKITKLTTVDTTRFLSSITPQNCQK